MEKALEFSNAAAAINCTAIGARGHIPALSEIEALIAKGRLLANRIVYIWLTLYSLLWVFGQTSRTFRVGTYSQWKAQESVMFYQDHTFLGMFIFAMVVWLAGVFGFYFNLRREGMRLA